MMLSLGGYLFSVNTGSYQQLQHTTGARWASSDRLNGAPALQTTGLPATALTLNGVIYPRTVLEKLSFIQLRASAQTRKPQWLVDGTGLVWGQWVINELQEQHTVFWPNGQARKITFELQLTQYSGAGSFWEAVTQ